MSVISELYNDAKFIAKYRGKLMKRQMGLNKQAPKVDEVAPDFTLFDISGDESVTLSDFRGKKPVVLVFGSYT